MLRNAKFQFIEPFFNGLSQKYKVSLVSGHHVMMKPVEAISFFTHSRYLLRWDELPSKRHSTLSRADRTYQGWAELAAFYLDRVMGLYRKPPIVGRVISSTEMYSFDNTLHGRVSFTATKDCIQCAHYVVTHR